MHLECLTHTHTNTLTFPFYHRHTCIKSISIIAIIITAILILIVFGNYSAIATMCAVISICVACCMLHYNARHSPNATRDIIDALACTLSLHSPLRNRSSPLCALKNIGNVNCRAAFINQMN